MKRTPLAVVIGLVAVALAATLANGTLFPRTTGSPGASPSPSEQSSGAPESPGASASASASPVVPSPSPSRIPAGAANVPIVPVVDFRSTLTGLQLSDVRSVLSGASTRFSTLELVTGDASGILAALQVARPSDATRLTLVRDVATLATDLAKDSKRLAFLRASQVDPRVRALAWAGRQLFGVHRVRKTSSWPLTARLSADARPFDASTTWTVAAGGDILLDRGVYKQVEVLGKGVDFPFAGGTAEITGHSCCSIFGLPVPTTRRTGNPGAVRDLLRSADLALANFENPAPTAFTYHTQGTVFSADPRLIAGVRNAGIDYVSIANNHIGDAGRAGILQTISNLDRFALKHSGAGATAAAAHKAAYMRVGGVTVAVLAYDTIAKYYAAGPSTPGSAQLTVAGVRADVAAARRAGAKVVIVYPHWGTEYDPTPFPGQQALARAVIDAGADTVIGNHAHWVGAMEIYRGRPIWYALGNFVFDQTWSEPTMEGMLLELTFRGSTLVQVRLHPTIILDAAQPNFLDPAGDGRVVLGQLYDASRRLLPW